MSWLNFVLLLSAWQDRRVACTDSVLAFSHPEKEKLLEVIPLSEIVGVQEMGGLEEADLDDDAGRIQLEITLSDYPCFCLTNCFSRKSTFATDDKENCRKIFESIDTDKTGTCGIDKLTTLLKKMCYNSPEKENIIKTALQGKGGNVTFDEFWDLQIAIDISQRTRELKVKVIKAENILNSGYASGRFRLHSLQLSVHNSLR
jgi:hypothetical protein